ncbi:3-oxoadipate enol-lactonase [Tranquillimonas rosea]|uniref:3-oxoadipate enol-lactonase n=1 Tax=Tranquillimonas rosea TaxID=641238 RepID=A0A1H9X7X9_9RHOB|nr:3-oxoadipate enol-lactonase [Tranquillimonas rosea]SES42296.1 3-oxoadipate enol-lactonase [Tranquillimonas rosea]
MKIADLGDIHVHYRIDGDPEGHPVVFANSLGTDLRLWDAVVALMPPGVKLVRYDKRGHGLTDCPKGPYSMGTLIGDAERLMDHLELKDAVFVGLSIGGMIAQGLAMKRMDLVRAMVMSNTAAKIGTPDAWDQRIATVREQGIEPLADGVMEKWFTQSYRETTAFHGWRNMLIHQPPEGYAGCCAAISHSDFMASTAQLTLPTLAIAGSEDGSTPPDLVRETADLVQGSRFELIRGAGHLPCVEKPVDYAGLLTGFLHEVGHA